MNQTNTSKAVAAGNRGFVVRLVAAMSVLPIVACEAPLNLEDVAAENARQLTRYDMFQAATHHGDRAVVVSSSGAAIVSDDNGESWQRYNLAGRPSLIDVTACASGNIYALDSQKRVWSLPASSDQWSSSTLDTPEDTLSIHCAPGNRLWVSASFSTLYSRDEDSPDWQEFSLYEDLQFTNVRFVDQTNGFAVGEFGTVIASTDGGATWEPRTPIPNDFYPMGSDFLDTGRGWVGGLDGVIWRTEDGGETWERQESLTSSPIYSIHATADRVLAAGGSAKLVEFVDGQWRDLDGAPKALAYLRGIDTLASGALLVAGGAGTLAVIPPKAASGRVVQAR